MSRYPGQSSNRLKERTIGKRTGRRANGEGSIYQRKDGRWAAEWTAQTLDGPRRRTVYGRTQAEVVRKRKDEIAQERGGMAFHAGRTTVGEYLGLWLEDSVKTSVKPVTYESYRQLVRKHLIPSLGRNKLGDLTPEKVRRLRGAKLSEGLSTRTVQYLLVVLRKALQQAVEDGLIPRNAAQGVRVSQNKEEIRPLSPEQARVLLDAAWGTRLEALYVLAVHTGLRQGELFGLRWEDIDFTAGTLSVKRILSGAEGGRPVFGTPKTAKSRRSVRLTAPAVGALLRHREAQERERATVGSGREDNHLVFRSTTDTPLNRHNLVRRSLKPLLKKAGLPDIRFHDLRHTCATILLSKGKHPKYVQALLGHATVAITLDTYSHVLPGMNDGLAEAMEDALS